VKLKTAQPDFLTAGVAYLTISIVSPTIVYETELDINKMKIENQVDSKDSEVVNVKEASSSGIPPINLHGEEKRRRAWEQWSIDDIAAFFEGLNEFGKDFDAIQNCLFTKSKKKNLVNSTNTKNKDQVRHFYYRTWHKISKYLSTSDEGKRMHRELYGLINYGEMWKKLGGYFNDRCGEKLNELVQLGVTSVKIKGKSQRIKTPVCPALKRLQTPGTDPQKLPSIPERVVMELTPSCNADFLRVQSVAHNPRIRICADSSTLLSSIIAFLTKKWKPRSIHEAETVAEDELIMRLAPDTRQDISAGANKKTRKRQMSGQDPTDEPEPKAQSRSWILDTVDQATVGEVYTLCGATDARLPLIYNWERRTKLEPDVGEHQEGSDTVSLLRALINVAKSSLTKSSPVNDCPAKKTRRQIIPAQSSEDNNITARSPMSESSPSQSVPMESPVQFSRMRQRLRRPMRYGLKRGSLASTLNKMAGPSTIARPHPSSLMAQSTTMNISWPPEANGNGTGSFVLQVNLNGQPPTNNDPLPASSSDHPPITNNEMPLDHPMPNKIFQSPHSPDHDLFRPPSILLHTPVKGAGGSVVGWGAASSVGSLPSTPNRLQEWMSLLLPNTPEKEAAESSSAQSVLFSVPDSFNAQLSDNFNTASSVLCGDGSSWPKRDGDEISLSSLLNQLVSPAKSTASSRYTDLKLPFDLQSLVADNSVDLTAKFAELAASIAAADTSSSKHRP